jgi:hypothetical protein
MAERKLRSVGVGGHNKGQTGIKKKNNLDIENVYDLG